MSKIINLQLSDPFLNRSLKTKQLLDRQAMRNNKDPELWPILGGASKSASSMNPHPGPISRRTRFLLVVCILFTELCERLTFYGIVANLVLYCRDYLKLEAPLPSSISLAFQGRLFIFLSYMLVIFSKNILVITCNNLSLVVSYYTRVSVDSRASQSEINQIL